MKILGVGAGQAVSGNDVTVQGVVLTAAGADATLAVIDADSNTLISIAAKAGTTAAVNYGHGGRGFSNKRIKGPVTATVTGAGAFAEIAF